MSHTEHLLLVEDDPGLRELLQEELEAEGYRVSACASAEAAQPLLQQGDIDLLISDLRLPGANGLSLLPVAQSLNPAPAMLIITAFGSVQQAVQALQQGADDFLTKRWKWTTFCSRPAACWKIAACAAKCNATAQSWQWSSFTASSARAA